MSDKNQEPIRQLVESGSEAAPALLGAAAGILLADLMHERARRPVAFSLACIGLAALAPSMVGVVRHKDTNAISFHCLDCGPGCGAVVSPAARFCAGCELVLHLFGHQVKLLHAAIHSVRQRPAVERADAGI